MGGYQNAITQADSFQILTAGSLSGTFGGIADGARIETSDGFGSFVIDYTPDRGDPRQ